MTNHHMNVEIVVPVYNEQGNVEELYRQVVHELEPLGLTFGFLFVDDGSRDRTVPILEELSTRDPRVRFLSFTRNFGHQAALLAGLEHSIGDCVITMDGDLQHPPHVLPSLVRHWQDGAEIVVTTRDFGTSMGPMKRMATSSFYQLMNRISGVRIPPGAADFRLLDRRALETIVSFPERQKFLRGLASWTGHRTAIVEYKVGRRHAGEVKYSLAKLAQLGWNGVTSFSAVPLRLAFYLGLVIFAGSGLYGLAAIIAHFAGQTPTGWTSVLVCILAIGGLQMIFIGLIGEYLARVFDEVKGRPSYILKTRASRPEPARSVGDAPLMRSAAVIEDRSGN
jgi:dolichol-phosphate mannosyltransferase